MYSKRKRLPVLITCTANDANRFHRYSSPAVPSQVLVSSNILNDYNLNSFPKVAFPVAFVTAAYRNTFANIATTSNYIYKPRCVSHSSPSTKSPSSTTATESSTSTHLPKQNMKTFKDHLASVVFSLKLKQKQKQQQQQQQKEPKNVNDISLSNILLLDDDNNNNNNAQIFIIGNEAGDADSIISALALSYCKEIGKNKDDPTTSNYDYIPIVSIKREDMTLRRDVVLLLSMVGIHTDHDLIYINDDDVQGYMNMILSNTASNTTKTMTTNINYKNNSDCNTKTNFILVDHNKQKLQNKNSNNVMEIWDHHEDEGFHSNANIRHIAFQGQKPLVGSTCTLITEQLQDLLPTRYLDTTTSITSPPFSQKGYGLTMLDPGIALSLLGVILLDTMNMNPEVDKGTIRDENAIQFLLDRTDWDQLVWQGGIPLEEIFTISNTTNNNNNNNHSRKDTKTKSSIPDRVKLYNYLRNAKFDQSFWNEMSVRDTLRIDYKQFESTANDNNNNNTKNNVVFGLSSVLLPISTLMAKENFVKEVILFMKKGNDNNNNSINNDLDLLGIMSLVVSKNVPAKRELLFVGNETMIHTIRLLFSNDNNTSSASFLQISAMDDDNKLHQHENSGQNQTKVAGGLLFQRFHQRNSKGSRKQLAPVLLKYFVKN